MRDVFTPIVAIAYLVGMIGLMAKFAHEDTLESWRNLILTYALGILLFVPALFLGATILANLVCVFKSCT